MYLPLTASFLSLTFFTGLCVLHRPTGSLQGAQCTRQSMDGATAPVNVSCVDTSSPADGYVYTACLLHPQVILMIHITIIVVLVANHITILVVRVANHIILPVVLIHHYFSSVCSLPHHHSRNASDEPHSKPTENSMQSHKRFKRTYFVGGEGGGVIIISVLLNLLYVLDRVSQRQQSDFSSTESTFCQMSKSEQIK